MTPRENGPRIVFFEARGIKIPLLKKERS